jgi:hypothetical protein
VNREIEGTILRTGCSQLDIDQIDEEQESRNCGK